MIHLHFSGLKSRAVMPTKYKWSVRGVVNRMPLGGVAQLVCIATSFVCLLTFVIYYFGGVKVDYVLQPCSQRCAGFCLTEGTELWF